MADEDRQYMLEALAFAEQGRVTAPPNPWVGCVIVLGGKVVGRGFHRKAGLWHAEVEAIADAIRNLRGDATLAETKGRGRADDVEAGDLLRGATAYVTLEPCHHTGRQPPCDQRLKRAGLKRVVVCVLDPDERVAGQGVALLRDAGIEVTTGVCEGEGHRSLAPYLHQRRTQRPLCVVKTALSLDGMVACADRTSQWITGEEARADVHRLRAESQAIIVGSGTALADSPRLNVRLSGVDVRPLRVLLDSRGSVTQGPLFDTSIGPTLVCTTAAASPEARAAWERSGVEVAVLEAGDGGVSLPAVLAELGRRGVLQAMVEGGARLHGALLAAGLADRLVVYHGATVLGAGALPWAGVPLARTMREARFWRLLNVRQLGDDVRSEYEQRVAAKL